MKRARSDASVLVSLGGGSVMVAKYSTSRNIRWFCLFLGLVAVLSAEARAEMYSPSWEWAVVENNSGIAGTVAEQLSVDLADAGLSGDGKHQVLFTFTNAGPEPSSITRIYFENGPLQELATIFDVDYIPAPYDGLDGVDFGPDPKPANLPGGNSLDPKFVADAAISVGSEPKVKPNGIGPGEHLDLLYTLDDGKIFDDVIAALNFGFGTPIPGASNSMRIGMHIQGVGENAEFSDTLLLTPIPGSLLLGMLGLGAAGVKLRKYA